MEWIKAYSVNEQDSGSEQFKHSEAARGNIPYALLFLPAY